VQTQQSTLVTPRRLWRQRILCPIKHEVCHEGVDTICGRAAQPAQVRTCCCAKILVSPAFKNVCHSLRADPVECAHIITHHDLALCHFACHLVLLCTGLLVTRSVTLLLHSLVLLCTLVVMSF